MNLQETQGLRLCRKNTFSAVFVHNLCTISRRTMVSESKYTLSTAALIKARDKYSVPIGTKTPFDGY